MTVGSTIYFGIPTKLYCQYKQGILLRVLVTVLITMHGYPQESLYVTKLQK